MCWMEEAEAEEKRPWMKKIPSMNIIRPLLKWRPLFCKAKKQADGGCSYQIKNLSPAAIKTIFSQAAMRYRKDGFVRKSAASGEWRVASGMFLLAAGFLLPG